MTETQLLEEVAENYFLDASSYKEPDFYEKKDNKDRLLKHLAEDFVIKLKIPKQFQTDKDKVKNFIYIFSLRNNRYNYLITNPEKLKQKFKEIDTQCILDMHGLEEEKYLKYVEDCKIAWDIAYFLDQCADLEWLFEDNHKSYNNPLDIILTLFEGVFFVNGDAYYINRDKTSSVFATENIILINGETKEFFDHIPNNFFDLIVTDPPYPTTKKDAVVVLVES